MPPARTEPSPAYRDLVEALVEIERRVARAGLVLDCLRDPLERAMQAAVDLELDADHLADMLSDHLMRCRCEEEG